MPELARQLPLMSRNTPNPNHVPGTALRGPAPRKKPTGPNNFKSYGRHFCRTVHPCANMGALVQDGLKWIANPSEAPDEESTLEERREHETFNKLLKIASDFDDQIQNCSLDDVDAIVDMLQKGAQSARSDDTKSLKGPIIEWITPAGGFLPPPLMRNRKADRGFKHDITGAFLCPTGLEWHDVDTKNKLRNGTYIICADQWPVFVYKDCRYDPDDPWKGLFRGRLLIKAYKHIFTSPTSVDRPSTATRKGNAKIHNMTRVTVASIAYVTMQVHFALSSAEVFTWNNEEVGSLGLFNSILDFLEDPKEEEEVDNLLRYWNQQIFPAYSGEKIHITKDSALARLKQSRKRKAADAGRRA